MSLDRDEVETIQDDELKSQLKRTDEEYFWLEYDLELLKRRRAIERLERERGE
jgi:hypothetical protein